MDMRHLRFLTCQQTTPTTSNMFITALCLAALAATTLADPKPPSFTYLYSINLTMPAGITIGNTPSGSRAILPISGGTFSGPRLSGFFSPHQPLPTPPPKKI